MRKSLLLLALLWTACVPALADDAAERGRALLEANCSRCHAIGPEDDSPHDEAPPFREVMKIYGADSLQEALAEGLITGHPDMPEFIFSAEDTGAIIAYLHLLEPKP